VISEEPMQSVEGSVAIFKPSRRTSSGDEEIVFIVCRMQPPGQRTLSGVSNFLPTDGFQPVLHFEADRSDARRGEIFEVPALL